MYNYGKMYIINLLVFILRKVEESVWKRTYMNNAYLVLHACMHGLRFIKCIYSVQYNIFLRQQIIFLKQGCETFNETSFLILRNIQEFVLKICFLITRILEAKITFIVSRNYLLILRTVFLRSGKKIL